MKFRPGLTAIAAVLALSSTPLLAQQVAAPTATAPQIAPAPAPTPAVTASTTTETITSPDPLAPAATATIKPAAKTTMVKRTTTLRTSAPRSVTRAIVPTASQSAAPVAVAAPIAAAPALPAAPPIVAAPVVAAPVAPTVAPASMSGTLPIAGAAGLGLLALAAAGFAMRRRKRRGEEEAIESSEWQEPAIVPAAVVPAAAAMPMRAAEPTAVPKRAFDWTPTGPVAVADGGAIDAGDATLAPDSSHFDAAMRGPTRSNPSLSLKRRLKRAAFFEQRDRQVAAGTAQPVSPMAGLPEAMTETAPPPRPTPPRPASPRPAVTSTSGSYRLQPA